MTPAQLVAQHVLDTLDILKPEQRVVLLRALAVETSDPDVAIHCRQLAACEAATADCKHQMQLNLRTHKSAA